MSTDDYASVLLHFENETRGVMTVSQVSAGRKARLWFEIDGSKVRWRSIRNRRILCGSAGVTAPARCFRKIRRCNTPESRGYAAYPGGHAEGYPDTFVQLFKDFYGYLAAGDLRAPRTFPTFETGHDELVLCEAIAESAQKKEWVSVGA